jgi:cytidylate kinase
MFRVITISREYGAGGASIGRTLADGLGWRLLDRELLEEVARKAHIATSVAESYDERIDPWLHRLTKQALWHGTVERPFPLAEDDLFDAEVMVIMCRQIIEEAANVGNCVIVGRGGQCILHGREGVFSVFLYAPIELRTERIARVRPNEADLEAAIRENDAARVAFIRRYFGQDWCNPYLYDLMVNTKHGYQDAAEAILTASGLKTLSAAR